MLYIIIIKGIVHPTMNFLSFLKPTWLFLSGTKKFFYDAVSKNGNLSFYTNHSKAVRMACVLYLKSSEAIWWNMK